MLRIASLIYTMASATVMGIFIIIVLVAGLDTLKYVITAAAAGAIVALPVSYFIAKAIKEMGYTQPTPKPESFGLRLCGSCR